MIKKLFVTFLAMLYLGVSSGATLHYQYCMGRLVKVALWHDEQSKKCNTCGMNYQGKAAKKCCTDKHQQLKSEKSSSLTYSQIGLGTSPALLVIPLFGLVPYNYLPLKISHPVGQSPPLVTTLPVFLRNCTFRI
ncbi:hypothetical protein J3L18_03775 [Mucilaginibacter gossypii]|uniref:HYC_CC_PP family protein n=1 Tax=Mucilaginibacter gossypii TaxID=551996 RepID=UPI000DCB96FF|nr:MULTISPECIES: hypothetical protein [Mucilaginibacter]QTE38201.1 hypothetical protein J3L18_03775 [Mucilaginibacter gossypii]RAV60324.1 hypothetical protein DIU36_01535 [Mucilaginibacter rubeus]